MSAEAALRQRLAALPPLAAARATAPGGRCKLCGGRARTFDVVDFNKFASQDDPYGFGFAGVPVFYERCDSCGLLFTRFFDDWTKEDFAAFVYNGDYGLVDGEYAEIRPAAFAAEMARRLDAFRTLRILDFGSGSGAFVRKLRDAGFAHVTGTDPFSDPALPEGPFDLITCWEVLEHALDPVATVRSMERFLAEGGCILFSQALQPPGIETIRAHWWYAAPRNGHATLHTADSLAALAQRAGLLFCCGEAVHGFRRGWMSAGARAALAGLETPLYPLPLHAPAEADPAWHGIERPEDAAYRWTRAATLSWPMPKLPAYPAAVRIRLPWANEIEPGFAAACRIRIGDQVQTVRLAGGDGRMLTADVTVAAPGHARIELLTPPPRSPQELGRGADDRALGIAISLESATPTIA